MEERYKVRCAPRAHAGAPFWTVIALLSLVLLIAPVHAADPDAAEEDAVLRVARAFLDAEIREDYRAVYDSLAPSSPYVKAHTYEEYLAEALAAEDRVVDYTIIAVTYIIDNRDTDTACSIEKIAQVEVEVVFLHMPSDRRSEINIGFIFLKEGGRWYKS